MKIASFNFENLDTVVLSRHPPKPAAAKTRKAVGLVEDLPPPPPPITEQDVEVARKEAYGQGFTQGAAEERRKIEQEQQAFEEAKLKVLQSVASGLTVMTKEYAANLLEVGAAAPDMVMAIARKVIGHELRYTPLPSLKQVVEDCLARLMDEPNIVVYVHPELVHDMETELQKLARQEDYPGTLEVAADDHLAAEDCRIEWKHGTVERNVGQIMAQIEAALKQQGQGMRSKFALESYDKLKDTAE